VRSQNPKSEQQDVNEEEPAAKDSEIDSGVNQDSRSLSSSVLKGGPPRHISSSLSWEVKDVEPEGNLLGFLHNKTN